MYYTVGTELELQTVAESKECGLPAFKSFDDAVDYVKNIQHLYLDHLSIYKMVATATYKGKAV